MPCMACPAITCSTCLLTVFAGSNIAMKCALRPLEPCFQSHRSGHRHPVWVRPKMRPDWQRDALQAPVPWPYWLTVWLLLTSDITAARSNRIARNQRLNSLHVKASMKVGTCI